MPIEIINFENNIINTIKITERQTILNVHQTHKLHHTLHIDYDKDLQQQQGIVPLHGTHNKSGRPFGTSNKANHEYQLRVKAAINKITARFVYEESVKPKGSFTKIGLFQSIHDDEKEKFNLKDKFKYPYSTMRSRIRRDRLKAEGNDSPLKPIEKKLLMLIKCMNNIKHSLSLSDGIALVNDLIQNTPVQKN